MRDHAFHYVCRNQWPVFGVARDCRTPIVEPGGFRHGVYDATADPIEALRRWTRVHPEANIALACGAPSGVFVLDVDVKTDDGLTALAALEDENGYLPRTWEVRTPSGGRHIYFRQPGRNLRNRVGFVAGLDVRSTGASVALPPSRKPSGAYAWVIRPRSCELAEAPAWLLDLIDPPPVSRAPRSPFRINSSDRAARYVVRAVEGECRDLATSPKGGRNAKLFSAAARLGELVGAGLLPQEVAETELQDAASECGLLQEDGVHAVRATIASGIRRGLMNPREVRL